MRSSNRLKVAALILLSVSATALAADKYWVGGGGNWNDTSHWSLSLGGAGGASQPQAGEDAELDDGGGGWVVHYLNPVNPAAQLGGVYVDGGTQLNLTAGDYDLNTLGVVLGWTAGSTSSIVHSQGTVATQYNLYVGYDSTSDCAYRVTGDGATVSVGDSPSAYLWVGYDGQGVFDQQAGLVTTANLIVNSTAGYVLSGTGELSVSGVEAIGYGYFAEGTFTQHGGTHTVGEQLKIGVGSPGTFYLNGGSLSAPAAYVGGTDSGPGSAASLLIGTGAEATFSSKLKLWTGGTVALNGGTLNVQSLELGGTFNFNSGTLEFLGGWDATPGQVTGILGAAGTIGLWQSVRVNGAATLFAPLVLDGGTLAVAELVNPGLLAFNSGTFELTSGELPVSNNGPFGATLALSDTRKLIVNETLTVASYGLVLVDGDALRTGALFNSGQVRLTGRTSRAVFGEMVNDGEIWLEDDAARLAILTAGGLNNGLIAGRGHVLGPLSNEPTGEIRVGTGDRMVLGHMTDNAGLVNAIGGTVEFGQYLTNAGNALISARSAELRFGIGLNNAGAVGISFGTTDVFGDVDNVAGGQIVISGNAQATFYDDVSNAGVVQVSNGSTAVFFGAFTGSAGTTGGGDVFLEGDTRPGSSAGAIGFGGNVTFGGSSSLQIELGGTAAGSGYDQVNVAGQATLSGTLAVSPIDAFEPAAGDEFAVLTYGSRSGEFAAIAGWDHDELAHLAFYGANDLTLHVTYFGDATLDGCVDGLDYVAWSNNYLTGDTWQEGDFNDDLITDGLDYVVWSNNYFQGCPALVPEPGALTLLGVGILALLRRRRS